jgi:hypothetical protein
MSRCRSGLTPGANRILQRYLVFPPRTRSLPHFVAFAARHEAEMYWILAGLLGVLQASLHLFAPSSATARRWGVKAVGGHRRLAGAGRIEKVGLGPGWSGAGCGPPSLRPGEEERRSADALPFRLPRAPPSGRPPSSVAGRTRRAAGVSHPGNPKPKTPAAGWDPPAGSGPLVLLGGAASLR